MGKDYPGQETRETPNTSELKGKTILIRQKKNRGADKDWITHCQQGKYFGTFPILPFSWQQIKQFQRLLLVHQILALPAPGSHWIPIYLLGGKSQKCTRSAKEQCKKTSPKKRGIHMRCSVYEIVKLQSNIFCGPQVVHGILTFVIGHYLIVCCTGLFEFLIWIL